MFGGDSLEKIQLNEDTIWSGGPNWAVEPRMKDVIPEIRRRIFSDGAPAADKWFKSLKMTTSKNGNSYAYQTAGSLVLKFDGHDFPTDYRRSLSLDEAVQRTSYRVDGVTYTRTYTAADEWNVLAESVPTSSVTFRIPDSVADEDIPALDRYLMHRTCVSTYTWQASPTRWALFGRNSDGDEWTEIERVDNGFFYSRDQGKTSPPCECAHENALKARVRYRQYRFAFYSTRQNHGLRLVELQLVVDDGTAGNVIRVTPDGTGDGSDWENAANLQAALGTAQRGDELWLKAGDYPLTEELSAPTACAILGGFAGNEMSKAARTGTARSVIDATAVDNALVMTDVSFDDYILENLAITNAVLRAIKMGENGRDNGTEPKSGAGLRARNCLIAHNGTSTSVTACEGHGAMIYTVKGAPVSFTGCTFDHNQMLPGNGNRTGNQHGMAICVRFGALSLADCAFTDNGIPQFVQTRADGRDKSYGGAIYAEHASINAVNCLFRGNRQVCNGSDGSIVYMNGNPEGTNTFVGCRFVGNSYAHFSVNISSTIRFSTSPDANGARPTTSRRSTSTSRTSSPRRSTRAIPRRTSRASPSSGTDASTSAITATRRGRRCAMTHRASC